MTIRTKNALIWAYYTGTVVAVQTQGLQRYISPEEATDLLNEEMISEVVFRDKEERKQFFERLPVRQAVVRGVYKLTNNGKQFVEQTSISDRATALAAMHSGAVLEKFIKTLHMPDLLEALETLIKRPSTGYGVAVARGRLIELLPSLQMEQLPELLSCSDEAIREATKKHLERLLNGMGVGQLPEMLVDKGVSAVAKRLLERKI